MGWFDRPEFGPNVGLIDDIYRRYLDDPSSVSPAWREFFAEHEPEGGDGQAARPADTRPADTRPAEDRPGRQEPAAPPAAPGEEQVPLKGIGARIVEAMESSLAVPTATSLRTVPARLLEVNRAILNNHLRRRRRGGKVSFTHLVGFAVARALAASPGMRATYAEVRGRPHVVRHEHVNLGLAVDVRRDDGTRVLLVPNVKQADTLDFARFLAAYQELLGKVRAGRLTVEDFAGTTVTITNPGTVGTVSSVPRLLSGQAAIVGVGAIDYPVEYQGADPARLAEIGVGKVLTLTSTYDHRVIQGAESGEFLARVHRLLLGEDGFYDGVFAAMGVPYVPVRWRPDDNPDDRLSAIEKQARVLQLINMYRVRGHLLADLDPLEAKPPRMPEELDPATFGFTIWDLNRRFVTGGLAGRRELELGEILSTLRDAYCRTATCEYMHISDPAQKHWIQERMEATPDGIDAGDQERILYKLGEAEAFERFLHGKYTGHKRFSLEGAETLIPMLDALLDEAADAGVVEVVMGMSHRGRLNVLANTIGKSYAEIFHEFEGDIDPAHPEGTGDVKYHLGAAGKHLARSGREVALSLASNPSHLESVNPVVEGIARARQDLLGCGADDRRDQGRAPVLPLLLHGDAAFAGQGVVAETLNLSQLPGYSTGGTVHVIVNNQLGFTTSPDYSRSSTYASDVAKMIQAPIWHVNGDDPEACVRVARQAFAFRQTFGKDVVIDMWCYRRWGHNETDEPAFTQPLMYARIKQRPSVRKLYTEALVNRGDLSLEGAERALEAFRARLQRAFDEATGDEATPQVVRARPTPIAEDPEIRTAVDLGELRELTRELARVPEGFHVHPKLTRWLEQRTRAVEADEPAVDFSLAEALAFATLLRAGKTVRLTGQDTRRGTFSHRHAVLVDQETGAQYVPLTRLGPGRFYAEDSLLSEFAAMGFEYGYTVGDPDALVLWEAQFGDFVNGGQIIVDQFLAAAEDKWGQPSGLVLLLPHGYEGQGPEHSSARPERFLQLAAHDNLQVTVPSTAAQYFHLLRRQALRAVRKPLVALTPKSLLRLPAARSRGRELAAGGFAEVLGDPARPDPGSVRRVLLCSGKIAHDLLRRREQEGVRDVEIVRLEQLYPFPAEGLRRTLEGRDGAEVVWVQEEPENMGAWRFVQLLADRELGLRPTPVAREEGAAPATGSSTVHQQEQDHLIRLALGSLG
ncbi:MAG TPA: multifunctional oxoglutarate decarboxylase/oxoglutarate dehydrogenase thiamine pyrophosphate-binding subunit/dihydrolipoyllysine-residue succinyltransferase subunit [Actinomycetes bacterium]|nr:multifunctional oxoglutarate decarboxylase/oxoglutarate dehydrogenase thiamine pyrophosphate-binding subunit/dihydrolipoyllysine-residue succinyltransferase subunit [Actinomycetes bacterium]